MWDWANQQVVRPGGEGPGVDTPPEAGTPHEDQPGDEPTNLDAMTKAELLDYAAENQVDADDSMTKADIRAAIETG